MFVLKSVSQGWWAPIRLFYLLQEALWLCNEDLHFALITNPRRDRVPLMGETQARISQECQETNTVGSHMENTFSESGCVATKSLDPGKAVKAQCIPALGAADLMELISSTNHHWFLTSSQRCPLAGPKQLDHLDCEFPPIWNACSLRLCWKPSTSKFCVVFANNSCPQKDFHPQVRAAL